MEDAGQWPLTMNVEVVLDGAIFKSFQAQNVAANLARILTEQARTPRTAVTVEISELSAAGWPDAMVADDASDEALDEWLEAYLRSRAEQGSDTGKRRGPGQYTLFLLSGHGVSASDRAFAPHSAASYLGTACQSRTDSARRPTWAAGTGGRRVPTVICSQVDRTDEHAVLGKHRHAWIRTFDAPEWVSRCSAIPRLTQTPTPCHRHTHPHAHTHTRTRTHRHTQTQTHTHTHTQAVPHPARCHAHPH
jgi:hypothetical protein